MREGRKYEEHEWHRSLEVLDVCSGAVLALLAAWNFCVMNRGWTLIEAIVMIAIVAIVIAISLSTITAARASAKLALTCSRLRENASIIHAYSADSRDCMPLPVNPKVQPYRIRIPELDVDAIYKKYFDAPGYWWLPLTMTYYNRTLFDPIWYPAEADKYGQFGASTFEYPCSFTARPEFWNASTRIDSDVQYGATRQAEVLFPTKKVLLLSRYQIRVRSKYCYPDGPASKFPIADPKAASMPSAFVDGSASVPSYSDVFAGYENGDGEAHLSDTPPACHTINGVRGRDVQ